MSFADLHTHSSSSDGTFDSVQILEAASRTPGLGAVAITDHDTLQAAHAAFGLASAMPIDFIPGVEVTTRHDGRTVHMLGYFVDTASKALNEFLDSNRERRKQRTLAMAERLAQAGFPVSPADIEQSGECANRPLLARMLVQGGCVQSVDEAFAQLLGSKSPYYVDAVYPETLEAMRLIVEANGFAFIAHPARYRVVDLIEGFSREGMTGLEAYHTQQTPDQSRQLVALAAELGLAVSGGSDWHGDEVHAAKLGGAGLDENGYHAFLRACGRM